jgi:hypothetical protein
MVTMSPVKLTCMYCQHPDHPVGVKCGVPNPVKPCKCKGKPGFWGRIVSNLGNAIGEAKFGG